MYSQLDPEFFFICKNSLSQMSLPLPVLTPLQTCFDFFFFVSAAPSRQPRFLKHVAYLNAGHLSDASCRNPRTKDMSVVDVCVKDLRCRILVPEFIFLLYNICYPKWSRVIVRQDCFYRQARGIALGSVHFRC